MGEYEGWAAQPQTGLLPNGLLPGKAASVIRALDVERWAKAEERTAELIACIQPNPPSEERRNAVANYVQRLIMECFPCKVFTFGSVPLKTYLPDGDIDLTAFSKNPNLKESWAHLVRDMLEKEEKNENAEFRVKEVQYIQAEVKIIKCLVENIVVDISFNQLGGLCTLCFLEEVDYLINQNHLFKRSIILIKAWCYYESRILGAHHGLISTYALETLVLYIFHVFNNSFAGPLEVLYRFLEFFSKFDWDNFCVSLWGPVPISSLPDVTAEPPRKDGGELLLSKPFLNACGSVYAVFPGGQENQGQPFVSKHFNVIDPLRVNNNLGRSVSKGNFFRIRSAFAFGAKKLARLLDCPKEDMHCEINQFFMNTWDRHGSGRRPDAPGSDLWNLRVSNPEPLHETENMSNTSSGKRKDKSSGHETQVDAVHGSYGLTSHLNNTPVESTSRGSVISAPSQGQKSSSGNIINSRTSDYSGREISSNQSASNGKGQRSQKPEPVENNFQARHLFARTRSSPELTETYVDVPFHSRRGRAPEAGKGQTDHTRVDNSRKKNQETETLSSHNVRSSTDASSVRDTSSRQSLDSTADTESVVNSYQDDASLVSMNKDSSVPGTQGMQQEEQDLANMMASSAAHGFSGQFHHPLNFASGHLPFPISPSILASMGYTQRNLDGIVPTNIPIIETPWGTNMQFPQGLVSSPFTHYFPGGYPPNLENPSENVIDNIGSAETPGEAGHNFWHEQERGSVDYDLENGGFEMHQVDEKQRSTSGDHNFVSTTQIGGSRLQQNLTRSTREDSVGNSQYQAIEGSPMVFDDRTTSSRSLSVSRASSVRSKTSSESSWDGSTGKVSKPTREKRNRKVPSSGAPSTLSGKGKIVSEQSTRADDDTREWIPVTGTELAERAVGTQPTVSFHVQRHQTRGFEQAQTSGSDSLIQISPVLLSPGSQQRAIDNSAGVNFSFYPTGPPVPFFAMLPVYNFQADAGISDASANHLSGDEGLENNDPNKNFDSSEGLDQSEVLNSSHATRRAAFVEPLEHKSDILNGDFVSHWQNLLYGRFCQNSRFPAPMLYPSPVVVPPVYLQGRVPWDGPGRPLASNTNIFNQLVSYGPRLVPVAAPLQSVSARPANVYPRYSDEMPRHRSGTGTYFPNPISVRERHSTSTRRGNYSNDRNDHYGDRDGSWHMGSKHRGSGRNHNRSQAEKSISRYARSDRHSGSYRHESLSYPYHSQNGPVRSNASQGASANMAYGMYRLPGMKPDVVNAEGHNIPSVVMLYPYDHNSGYSSSAEQLEFGSLGPMGFLGANEVAHLNESSFSQSGAFEEPRFHGASTDQMSSPNQPSSPHLPRRR